MLDFNESEASLELPDRWQDNDPRIYDCPKLACAINDTFDLVSLWCLLDIQEIDSLPSPLELAKMMYEAANRIERFTEKKE